MTSLESARRATAAMRRLDDLFVAFGMGPADLYGRLVVATADRQRQRFTFAAVALAAAVIAFLLAVIAGGLI